LLKALKVVALRGEARCFKVKRGPNKGVLRGGRRVVLLSRALTLSGGLRQGVTERLSPLLKFKAPFKGRWQWLTKEVIKGLLICAPL
jgi:hypothetical protein